jgi:AsmA protein
MLRPRRRRRRWRAVAGYLLLALACTLVASLTFFVVAAPVDFVRDQLVQQVKTHWGRDLVIAGPTSISLLPQVSVRLGDVSLSEPPGMGSSALLTAETFAIDVPLLALLSRQFAVKRLLLVRPTIDLKIDAEGRHNWTFAARSGAEAAAAPASSVGAPGGPTTPPLAQASRTAGVGSALDRLSLENVEISDGTVRYSDERNGRSKEVRAIALKLSLADPAGPLLSKGSLSWNGEKIAFDGKVSPARALLLGDRGRVALALSSRLFETSYDGTLSLGQEPALEGKARLKAASLNALAQWLDRHAGAEAGAVEVAAALSLDKGRLALADLAGVLGSSTLSGNLALETERPRPYLSGSLRASELDLGRLLLRTGASGRTAEAKGTASAEAELAPAGPVAPATSPSKRRGHGSHWSEAPIEFAILRLADADIGLVVDRVLYRELETGQSELSLNLADGVAKLTLKDTLLYGGRGRGVLSFDASGAEPATSTDLVLDNVSYRPLLKDALGLEWLTGRGKMTLSLSGKGESERKIIETLKGKAELAIGNGEFAGIDVGKILRAVEQAHFQRLEVAPQDKTPFSELAGTFQINNGVAETNDLRLVGPSMRVSGSGSSNLIERSADYQVRLKFAETAPSEGAVIKVSGLELPMHISGPWERLAFKPDLKGIATSEQASEAIRQIGKNLNSPEVREAVKGLLNGEGQQRSKAKELLEKLLKKQ